MAHFALCQSSNFRSSSSQPNNNNDNIVIIISIIFVSMVVVIIVSNIGLIGLFLFPAFSWYIHSLFGIYQHSHARTDYNDESNKDEAMHTNTHIKCIKGIRGRRSMNELDDCDLSKYERGKN